MKTNAAIGLLVAGIAFWLCLTQPREGWGGKLAQALGFFTLVLGGLTLYQYIVSVDLGIDRFFLDQTGSVGYYPEYDRMAPLATISFVFVGIILLGYGVESTNGIFLIQMLALILLFGSLVGLFGHVYVLPNWFGPHPNFLSIALSAAVLFAFLGVSVLFSRPEEGLMVVFSADGIAGSLARGLTIFAVVVPTLLDRLTWWGEKTSLFDADSKNVIDISGSILIFTIVIYHAANWVFRLENERKNAREVLQKTVEGLARTQEIAHLGSWELDLRHNQLTWSDEVYRIFGFRPQDFAATYEAFLESVHPSDRPALNDAFQRSVREGMTSYEFDHRIVRPGTNEVRWVKERCRYERDGKGAAVRAFGMVLDITHRVEAEESLRRMAEDLARSNRDLEQFAFVASHDLQEPLRMVSSYLQLLERRYKGKLDPDADEFIAYAVNGAKRMRNLINDLLAYSRLSRGPREFPATPVEAILHQVEADLELTIQASGGTITHGPLPTIRADPGQLAQVLQNLIGNALKFKGDQPPQVQIEARKEEDTWVFSVRDNGIGFDPQYADQIFVIFQRLQGGEKVPGTGIGLAVCKKILERHGGRIWAESTPGKGSVFHFAMPERQGGLQ